MQFVWTSSQRIVQFLDPDKPNYWSCLLAVGGCCLANPDCEQTTPMFDLTDHGIIGWEITTFLDLILEMAVNIFGWSVKFVYTVWLCN